MHTGAPAGCNIRQGTIEAQAREPLPAHRDGRETLRLRKVSPTATQPSSASQTLHGASSSTHSGSNGSGNTKENGNGHTRVTRSSAATVQQPGAWSDRIAVSKQPTSSSWRLTSSAGSKPSAALPAVGASLAIRLPSAAPEAGNPPAAQTISLVARKAGAGPGVCLELRPYGVLHNLTGCALQVRPAAITSYCPLTVTPYTEPCMQCMRDGVSWLSECKSIRVR